MRLDFWEDRWSPKAAGRKGPSVPALSGTEKGTCLKKKVSVLSYFSDQTHNMNRDAYIWNESDQKSKGGLKGWRENCKEIPG